MSDVLIEVKGLKKYFKTKRGILHAVDNISFSIERGKTLGIVGESGCGKSTAGRAIIRLIDQTGGIIFFDKEDITLLSQKQMRIKRKDMQIIFQDPFSSLNPRKTIEETITQPLKINKIFKDKKARRKRVLEIMELVGLEERLMNSYPHELDGGRRQRVGIARALALNPKFIVCDEPVSALDVSIQAQILNLMKELQDKLGLTYLFITHDLSIVNHFSDDIAVMYLGRIVEKASSEDLFENPIHPYTKALLSAIPVPDIHYKKEQIIIKGEVTSPIEPPNMCRFASRCNFCMQKCKESEPALVEVSPGHFVSCFLASDEVMKEN